MNRSAFDSDRLMAEASEWLVRLNGEKVGTATRSHFIQWLMGSHVRVGAFLDASMILGEISNLKAMPAADELARAVREEPRNSNVIPLRATARPVPAAEGAEIRPIARRSLFRAAAAVTLASATGSLMWMASRSSDGTTTLATNVGEQRSVSLEDGTTVHLNTDSALSVKFEKGIRRSVLLRGEARFDVTKDPGRPFVVTTPQAVVRVLGTSFNVRIMDERTVVSVIEGHVRVVNRAKSEAMSGGAELSASAQAGTALTKESIELFANGQASVGETGSVQKNGGPPFGRAVGWTRHHIVIDDEPLSVLVSEFNRYNKQQLEIADPALAEHRVNGGFDAFDRASLLDYLRRYQGVQIDEEDGVLKMRRARPVAPGH